MNIDPTGEVRSNSHKFAFASERMAITAPNARVRLSRAVQKNPRRLLRASNEGTLATDPAPTGEYRVRSSTANGFHWPARTVAKRILFATVLAGQ